MKEDFSKLKDLISSWPINPKSLNVVTWLSATWSGTDNDRHCSGAPSHLILDEELWASPKLRMVSSTCGKPMPDRTISKTPSEDARVRSMIVDPRLSSPRMPAWCGLSQGRETAFAPPPVLLGGAVTTKTATETDKHILHQQAAALKTGAKGDTAVKDICKLFPQWPELLRRKRAGGVAGICRREC